MLTPTMFSRGRVLIERAGARDMEAAAKGLYLYHMYISNNHNNNNDNNNNNNNKSNNDNNNSNDDTTTTTTTTTTNDNNNNNNHTDNNHIGMFSTSMSSMTGLLHRAQ